MVVASAISRSPWVTNVRGLIRMARQEEGRVAGDANLCMIPGLAYFPRLTFVGPLFVPLPPVETFCAP